MFDIIRSSAGQTNTISAVTCLLRFRAIWFVRGISSIVILRSGSRSQVLSQRKDGLNTTALPGPRKPWMIGDNWRSLSSQINTEDRRSEGRCVGKGGVKTG